MIDVGNLNIHKSHYAADRLCELDGIEPLFDKPFFNEFAIKISDSCKTEEINRRLFEAGIIGGLDLSRFYPDIDNAMLMCVTETKTKEDIDNLVSAVSNIL
jgi:glycine dehydrogenase subunit 1